MRKALALKNYGDAPTPIGDPPAEPRHRSRKNTRRWCRGVEGREHRLHWQPGNFGWEETCSACHKRARICWHWLGNHGKCICGQHDRPVEAAYPVCVRYAHG